MRIAARAMIVERLGLVFRRGGCWVGSCGEGGCGAGGVFVFCSIVFPFRGVCWALRFVTMSSSSVAKV